MGSRPSSYSAKTTSTPRGERIATAHVDGHVRVWSATKCTLQHEVMVDTNLSGVRWFPDGRAVLAWTSEGRVLELAVPG